MSTVTFKSSMNSFFSLGASTQRERINSLKQAFEFIAKDDISSFVKYFLFSTNFGKETFLPIINEKFNFAILQNIKDLMESSPRKHLPALRSLITGQYSLAQLEAFGISMTRNEYTYSRKIKNQNKSTLKNYERAVPPSKEKIKKEKIKKIIAELLKNSFPTSQPIKKDLKEIYYEIEKEMPEYSTKIKFSLNKTKKEIYEKMFFNNEITIAQKTFYNLIPSNFIKSKKETDKCNICNPLKKLQKKEDDYRKDGLVVPEKLKSEIKVIKNHKKFQEHQKNQYDKDVNDLKQDDAIIVLDFKENIKVGGGPIETSQCFYDKTPVSVLGFALITKKDNIVNYEYHDFLSEILSHDSLFAGECLINLLKSDRCKNIKNLKIWSDNGNHFRSQEFLHFVFNEASKIIKEDIKLNRFVECHGKSVVDGHFGVLTRTFKQKEKELYIKNIHDLKKVFENEEYRKNNSLEREKSSNISQKSFFYIYDRISRGMKYQLKIKDLALCLSYTMIDRKLFASPLTFSCISNYREIEYNVVSSDDKRSTKRSEDTLNNAVEDDSARSTGPVTSKNIVGRIILLSKTTTFFNLDNN